MRGFSDAGLPPWHGDLRWLALPRQRILSQGHDEEPADIRFSASRNCLLEDHALTEHTGVRFKAATIVLWMRLRAQMDARVDKKIDAGKAKDSPSVWHL